MSRAKEFKNAVDKGGLTGRVIAVKRYIVKVKGMHGAPTGAYVVFENGDRGIIRDITDGIATVLNCDSESTVIGAFVTVKAQKMVINVGQELLGQVVDPFGQTYITDKSTGALEVRDIFSRAPGIADREALNEPLYTGVTIVDSMFPVVKGQRIAILGDSKTGKTSFLQQLAATQASRQTVLVFVLIGKRRSEIEALIAYLEKMKIKERSVVVVSDVLDSLAQSYLAPYAGCAIAEHFWLSGHDTVVMYDDLTAHAKVYREISLLADANPGRDSYPGDMFYAHSSLLERAGKLKSNGKTLTALPVLLTPNDDITAYLPTSVMSITDGQLIFDLATFRRNVRPALNVGLSVSRVGGRGQTKKQKDLTRRAFKLLAEYREAEEFSHFGSESSDEMKATLQSGVDLMAVFKQRPEELFDIREQEALIATVLQAKGKPVNVDDLRAYIRKKLLELEGVSSKSSKKGGAKNA